MSNDQKTTNNSTQGSQQDQQTVTAVYRGSRDPLAANLSWTSIKDAWRELKNS